MIYSFTVPVFRRVWERLAHTEHGINWPENVTVIYVSCPCNHGPLYQLSPSTDTYSYTNTDGVTITTTEVELGGCELSLSCPGMPQVTRDDGSCDPHVVYVIQRDGRTQEVKVMKECPLNPATMRCIKPEKCPGVWMEQKGKSRLSQLLWLK